MKKYIITKKQLIETFNLNNKNIIKERLIDLTDDVDMLYDLYFKNDIEKINKNNILTDDLFKMEITDSSILKSKKAIEAHNLYPIKILVNDKDSYTSNHFSPLRSEINIGVNKSAINFVKEFNGDLNKAIKDLDNPKQQKSLKQEFSEEKIKGSIYHELIHWLDEAFNKNAISRTLNKYNKNYNKNKINSNINTTYIERQAQIYNIKEIYRKYKDIWDTLTFDDLISLSPSLNSIYNNKFNYDEKKFWKRKILQRMNREGLLGKNMYNKLNEELILSDKLENNNVDDYVVKYQINNTETNEITNFTISIKRFQNPKTKEVRYEPTLFLRKNNQTIKTDYKHTNKEVAKLILKTYKNHIEEYIQKYNAKIFVLDYNNPRFRDINKKMFESLGFEEFFIAENYYKYVKKML